ncbi:hypothetical protein NBRC110019_29950 [Neptunitalea chrysea]|uniref:DUF3570 domain-containing protein n=1 Tax=Neptunitalea chrysea TaxID=1647581 RepID=A0A9W6B977_9FLAO|nr:DUF3570 domain-containing protein [Neptunitalea chrysea]GLB53954.1 hypothetical protein NBRC110019_29950 [Neptunitalea chrysea]
MRNLIIIILFFAFAKAYSQQDSKQVYKKRVLETTEIDFLTSYYGQDGDNAAVSGGIGTEELNDFTTTFVVSIPLNDDDVLTIDAGISAYTSASSSNVDPFDDGPADPFQASSGASAGDVWSSISGSYSHSSNDRNSIVNANLSIANEYDYFSLGFGGSYTKLFNEKNTELSISANVFLDSWTTIYPTELRPFGNGGNGLNNDLFTQNTITGNQNYTPIFNEFSDTGRNSYSVGLGFSQILTKNIQGSLSLDVIQQEGLLSTPFQRVYFADIDNSFIDHFHLAEAIEQLPDSRFKIAIGGRLNWYLNEKISLRTFYRYYFDDWGITSHTASIEVPIKLSSKFTIYPSYRFYNQTKADYFRPYETALSTETYYTSDYDLSQYSANQFGLGVSYTDIFTKTRLWNYGIKSIDLRFFQYDRNTTFSSGIITAGIKFVRD